MTLLLTEFHRVDDAGAAFIVFAADRRITLHGKPQGDQQKIFRVDRLNAGVGFFGLAEMPNSKPMTEWLQQFLVREIKGVESLGEFAERLADALNAEIPVNWQKSIGNRSGFHIAGFTKGGQPEFWIVKNVADDYVTMAGKHTAREDLQRRDAPGLVAKGPGAVGQYRNGDIRALVTAWAAIDESLEALVGDFRFKRPVTPDDFAGWVKFKLEIIARFYELFAREPIIGVPIDVFYFQRENRGAASSVS